jgi:3-deoxy-D-manno-octulosonic-acid transferase
VIIALWHGQFLLLPGIYPKDIPGRAMIARHDDAEALARVLRRFGLGLIRGAGAGARRRDRGGAEAAHGAVASLRENFSIAMTADVPPGPARKCGIGIVTVAALSGRPIVPFALASSRYWAMNSWDRMTINLPFSELGIVMGDPICVPADASREVLENYRRRVEVALNDVTAKAYCLAGADMTRAIPVPKTPASV